MSSSSSSSSAASMPPMQPPLVLPPILKEGESQRGTIIWSHGLGDSAHGWSDFAHFLQRKNEVLSGVKYDIARPDASPSLEDVDGMLASAASIRGLIEAEVADGVEEGKVVGGVLSLLTGLTHPGDKPLGGICVLSGFLPLMHEDKLLPLLSPSSALTPLFWAHGLSDSVIRFSKASAGKAYLGDKLGRVPTLGEEGKGPFEWREYEGMGHELGRQEIGDVERWLEGRFA
ncbi:hypothetical protein JCM6882_002599 [Rhodosporidiobolus microsporus]